MKMVTRSCTDYPKQNDVVPQALTPPLCLSATKKKKKRKSHWINQ